MFTKEKIEKYMADGLIFRQKHPTAELYIYNYSKTVQYNRLWDEITLACRGLILDGDNNIVSRPFEKFFNYTEPEFIRPDPNIPFKMYDKLDGSLGVSYKLGGEVFIASRGSFDSMYAVEANKMLREKYFESMEKFEDGKTYLFEIIFQNTMHITIETDKGKVTYHENDMVNTKNRGLVRALELKEGDEI